MKYKNFDDFFSSIDINKNEMIDNWENLKKRKKKITIITTIVMITIILKILQVQIEKIIMKEYNLFRNYTFAAQFSRIFLNFKLFIVVNDRYFFVSMIKSTDAWKKKRNITI